MVSKTLMITEDVYIQLKELKKKGESFSDLLRRLVTNSNGQYLEDFFGAWNIDDEEFSQIQKTIQKSFSTNNKPRAVL